MKKDRSLLFGMFAVSMKKVEPDKMSEIARRAEADPNLDLGNSLVEEGLISLDDKKQIDSLIEMSLAENDGDASKTLQEFGKDPNKIVTMVDSMDDFVAAFESSGAKPAPSGDTEADIADSILGNMDAPDTFGDGGPLELDSLVDDGDPARTRITQAGQTGDRASIGDIAMGDAPDSFFQSIANTDTQIMSPVQAAAEIDESEIVPAVSEHDGRYETIREFAKGGMGQITLVHDTHLGRDIALKQLLQRNILPETRPGAPTTAILTIPIIARFLQEARITGQLEHPSIIPVYELGYRADGSLYYTMKLIRGQSMHEVLKDCKDLRDRMKMLPHFLDLCQAISYAHSRGVIHRDLKPMNIMIGEFGETVVIDWGIAKVKGQDDIHERGLRETVQAMRVSSAEATAKTMYGQTIGSPYFMPAEQAMGRTDLIDERSDIYSLGAVLYVILTGQMPYAGSNVREFMGKVGQVDPKPVNALEPEAPKELAAIVKKAMAAVPENRYQSARELTTEIQEYLSGGMVSAYDYSFTELAKRFYKKHRVKILGSVASLVALIVFGAIYSVNVTFQKNRALKAEKEAKENEAKALAAEEVAVEQKVIAESERERAQRQLYYANIANAKFNINEQQMASARTLLATPETQNYRDWEWGFLQAETHADLLSVTRSGRLSEFTPDGTGLITGTVNGSVAIHDLNTGDVLHEFISRVGPSYAIAGSGDMSRIAVMEDNGIHVWDVANKTEIFSAAMPEAKLLKYYLAFSANGKYLAGLAADKVLRIWEVDSGTEVVTVDDCQPNGFNIFFSPDGSHLLVARQVFGENGFERGFEVFSIPSGESVGAEVFPEDSVVSVHTAAFSPDSKLVAIGTDSDLQIWSIDGFKKSGEVSGLRFGHPDELAFSPDGRYVAAGTKDGALALYEVESGKVTTLPEKAHEDFIRSVRFTHGGTRVGSVADDNTVRLWSVPGLKPVRTFRGHNYSVYTLGFSQDDTRMASSSPARFGKTRVWDVSADLEFAPTSFDTLRPVHYDRKSGLVAAGTKDQVILWKARTGHRVLELAAPGEAAKALAFSSDGTTVAAVVWNGEAEVLHAWDVASGAEKFTFPTGQTATEGLHFVNGDSAVLVYIKTDLIRYSVTGEGGASIFDGISEIDGKTLYRYEVSPAATHLAAGFMNAGERRGAAVYMALDGDVPASSIGVEEITAISAHFTPTDDRLLVCQADFRDGLVRSGSIFHWNLQDNSRGESVSGNASEIWSVRHSQDRKLLATGDSLGTVALWNADTLEKGPVLQGHSAGVEHMDFNKETTRLVTGSRDRTFKIWELTEGKQLLTLNDSAVRADLQVALPEQVTFSEDGLQLATITSPPISPMILHAFSTDMADYPEAPPAPEAENGDTSEDVDPEEAALEQFEARVEAYKRQYWRAE